MARHISENVKLAGKNEIITLGKKKSVCDKNFAVHTISHKQQRSVENHSDQHDAHNDKSKISILKIVC